MFTKKWTVFENKNLRLYYTNLPKLELMNILSQRSWSAIRQQGYKFGLTRTTGHPSDVDLDHPLLAYALGVIMGDGNIWYDKKHNAHIISLQTTEKLFAESLMNALKIIRICARVYGPYERQKIEGATYWNGWPRINERPFYHLKACSILLHKWYQQFDPKTNPDWLKNLESYLNTHEKIRLFLKGFYEAEGSIREHGGSCELTFSNNNKPLLILIRSLLSTLGYITSPNLHRNGKKCWNLCIYKKSIQLLKLFDPCIKTEPWDGWRKNVDSSSI